MELELSIIISQIVAFLVVLWVLKLFAWKPFLKMLKMRQDKITSEFQNIDLQKFELQRLRDEYSNKIENIDAEAKEILKNASERATQTAKEIANQAQLQAKTILENTKKVIDQEIVEAHQTLKENLVNLVIGATEKLVEEKIDPKKDEQKILNLIDNQFIVE